MELPTISLDTIRVATPCSADWNAMSGNDQVRFCSHCSLNVYNLSEMSRHDAEALVREKEGRLCVRFHQRADGTMITQDCPVGLRAVQARTMRRIRSMAAAITATLAGFAGLDAVAQRHVMGEVDVAPASQVDRTRSADSSQVVEPVDVPVEDLQFFVMGAMVAPDPETDAEPPTEPVEEPVDEPQTLMGDIAFEPADTAAVVAQPVETPNVFFRMGRIARPQDEPAILETSLEPAVEEPAVSGDRTGIEGVEEPADGELRVRCGTRDTHGDVTVDERTQDEQSQLR